MWCTIESQFSKFKKLSNMPTSDDENSDSKKVGHSQSDLFLNKQSVSDKMVADCVESLIGTYVFVSIIMDIVLFYVFNYYLFLLFCLKQCGIECGFTILHGLGIIPKEFIDVYKPNPNINYDLYNNINFSHILPGYEILERRIDYSFKQKHLLVQALTHPTYQFGFSECYQRLEFLGDAILG